MYKTSFIFKVLSLLLCLSSFQTAYSQDKPIAFPGAEGFGRYTTGGRGGAVYHVTNLNDSGTGSFRWACERSGIRTIVFDVSGTIHLKSELKLRNGNVTIAGQTAPGDGICIADHPFVIATDNVIMRFLRFRLGNKYVDDHEGDGLGGTDNKNIIVDHCSVSWSIDECLSVYGSENTTVQWCIAAQSLRESGHSKGAHGYGGNWGGSGATYHHNLLAHHESRAPRLGPRPDTQTDERMDMRNNVIYNWAGNGCYGGEGMNVNIVNNYYKPGPATNTRKTDMQKRIAGIGIRTSEYTDHDTDKPNEWDVMWHVWGDFYVDGNVNPKYSDVTNDNWTYGIYNQISNSGNDNTFTQETRDTMRLSEPLTFEAVTTHSAEMAYDRVLAYAGASLHRDWVDELVVNDTRNGGASCTGTSSATSKLPGIIDSQDDLKQAFPDAGDDWSAWPELKSEAAPLDTDGDGMPDAWEDANGLDKNNASDGKTIGADGYSNLERYMNSIVAEIMEAGNEGGTLLSGNQIYDDDNDPSDGDTVVYELSSDTYLNSDSGNSALWIFNNGFSISNDGGKGYSKGEQGCVKYSSGVQFTVNIPSGKKVTKVGIYGYDNYADGDSYLAELNGMEYSETDYVFPAKIGTTPVYKSYDIELVSPAEGTLTFKAAGKQCVWKLSLTTTTPTGISEINTDEKNAGKIYNLQGVEMKGSLQPGIYIRNGKKFVVK
ncbi:pectate lyase family protein [Xylanibacter rarus]|uniref:pectate lyase family protein n=1 Tax=Xylanibacter rarus TaxID=1676614 RepID=UPI000A8EE0DB|nr:pectate lyase [Xylanibacter rarus]